MGLWGSSVSDLLKCSDSRIRRAEFPGGSDQQQCLLTLSSVQGAVRVTYKTVGQVAKALNDRGIGSINPTCLKECVAGALTSWCDQSASLQTLVDNGHCTFQLHADVACLSQLEPFTLALQLGVEQWQTCVIGLNVANEFHCRHSLIEALREQGCLGALDDPVRYRLDSRSCLRIARLDRQCRAIVVESTAASRFNKLLAFHCLGSQRQLTLYWNRSSRDGLSLHPTWPIQPGRRQ